MGQPHDIAMSDLLRLDGPRVYMITAVKDVDAQQVDNQ